MFLPTVGGMARLRRPGGTIQICTQQPQGTDKHLIGGQRRPAPELLQHRVGGTGDVERDQPPVGPIPALTLHTGKRRRVFRWGPGLRHPVTMAHSSPGDETPRHQTPRMNFLLNFLWS
jgi:hypothetical protein